MVWIDDSNCYNHRNEVNNPIHLRHCPSQEFLIFLHNRKECWRKAAWKHFSVLFRVSLGKFKLIKFIASANGTHRFTEKQPSRPNRRASLCNNWFDRLGGLFLSISGRDDLWEIINWPLSASQRKIGLLRESLEITKNHFNTKQVGFDLVRFSR